MRLRYGLCLSCGLHEGLKADREASREIFESVLAEDEVRDKQWRLGNYEILEEIGRGGMGVIYRARQHHSRRIVAVKRTVSSQADSQKTLARFRREVEAAASLDHPNILPIYEVGESDGVPFFSMKYASGGSLQEVGPALRAEPRQSVQLMAKVARAVQCAHEHGILHRDLKPGNILLDGHGEPLVTDFGLAKWLDTNTDLTRTLTIFGTPGYIAPEQAKCPAANLTASADVYSLGAILFDLFTGSPPFLGEHALAVIQQATEKPAPKLRSLAPAVDRDLETICARCLEREPQARYRSAADLAEDMERWLDGRPIVARPVWAPMRTWRWSKRNPKLAVATAAAFSSAAAATFLFFCNEEHLSPLAAFAATAIAFCSAIAIPLLFFSRKTTPSPAPPAKSIAVLPFENVGDPESVYLTQGMQDEILNNLARIADLKVISRTSVMDYRPEQKRNLRQIAKTLRVAYVLEGSVQLLPDRIRVHTQLIEARSDTQIWAERYERDREDAFAIQSEIARSIAGQLQAKLSPSEQQAIGRAPAKDLTAFDLYAQAKNLTATLLPGSTRTNFLQGIQLLDEAVARDPTFFQAYCQLVYAHDMLYFFNIDHTPARLAAAEAALESALRLRPDAGEAHLARARHLYRAYLDYEDALTELELARQSLPNHPAVFELQAVILRRQGRWKEAIENFKHAADLDPRNLQTLGMLGVSYHWLRQYGELRLVSERTMAISPNDANLRAARELVELHANADTQPLHRFIDSVRATDPGALSDIADPWLLCALAERDPIAAKNALLAEGNEAFGWDSISYNHPLIKGVIARMTHDEQSARSHFLAARAEQENTLRPRPDYAPAVCMLGLIDAGLGRKEEALREGRRAMELLPLKKDAMNGAHMIEHFAMIAAWIGENDLACEHLAAALSRPSRLSYGVLKLLPFWDPLRGDRRFEELVKESKKPVALN